MTGYEQMLQDKHRFTKRYIKLQTNNNTQFYMTGYETCYKTDIWISMFVDRSHHTHSLGLTCSTQ